MSLLVELLAGAVGAAVGAYPGWRLGRRLEGHRTRFWLAVALVFVALTALSAAASVRDAPIVSAAALGVLVGVLGGMKYGSSPELRAVVASATHPERQQGGRGDEEQDLPEGHEDSEQTA